MKTKSYFRRAVLEDVFGLCCPRNMKHCWFNLRSFDDHDLTNEWFLFCGVWEREPVSGTLFDHEIKQMSMPKGGKALNLYTEQELGLTRKGRIHCPLCAKQSNGLIPLRQIRRPD